MSQYEQSNELKMIAEKIKEKYSDEFGHLDLDRVGFVKKQSKKTKKNRTVFATCRVVRTPEDMFSNVKYIISTNGEDFDDLTEEAQFIVVKHEMKHIDPHMDGKLVHHDVEDFADIINEYGTGWQRRKDLPNILE